MQPGDTPLASRLSDELERQISAEMIALVKTPSERKAGYIQGLQAALNLLRQSSEPYEETRAPQPPRPAGPIYPT